MNCEVLIGFKADSVIVLWIINKVTDFSINLILKFKQHKSAKVANFVYYEKTPELSPPLSD